MWKDGGFRDDKIPAEAKEILRCLAEKWGDVADASALQVNPLKGALTNEVFEIKWPSREAFRKVLVRIYGEGVDVFFNREDEVETFEFMSKQGQGPLLLGRFSSGRIEEFINARTLSAVDLRDRSISPLIAAKMKEFHSLHMPGPKEVRLWERMRSWLTTAKNLCSADESQALRLHDFEEEIALMESKLTGDKAVVFCHNDLQYGNIMMDENTKAITIIDYEYSSYNPFAYDIANHFCEMAADYHTETPHLLDYAKYPGFEERQCFVKSYMGNSGSDLEITKILEKVEKYTLASHVTWGLWGIVSEHVNEIDFDYFEYARQRLQQYWVRKEELLG